MAESRRITRLVATNFGGLEEVDITPSKDTLVTGEKGAGKTSVLELVRTILTGKGLRPHLVKLGEDKAVLLLKLDDGTTIKRTVKAPSTTAYLTVEKDGMKPAKPQSFIDALLGEYACNPVDFFNLSAKEQGATVLALTDLADAIGLDDYTALSGGELLDEVDYEQHPLSVLADVAKVIFDQRTEVNRDVNQKRGTADELLENVPEDFDAEATREATLGDLVDEQTAARQQNKQVEEAALELAKYRQLIIALEEQLKNAEAMVQERSQWLKENAAIDTAALDKQIHDFQEQQDILRTYDSAKVTQAEMTELSTRSTELTGLLKALGDKPAELLAGLDELPIDGMGMDAEHGVTINGIPLGDLSDGESIDLAIEIALRYTGELPILLINGLEALDSKSQEQLREKLIASPCQTFVTQVSEGGLVIEQW